MPWRPTRRDHPPRRLLHVELCRLPAVGAVLHTHSVWSTLLSHEFAGQGFLAIDDFEMLKGLAGVTTHEHLARGSPFSKTHRTFPRWRRSCGDGWRWRTRCLSHAFLIRRHGLYTWGRDLGEAMRHVEVLEFLFECLGRQRGTMIMAVVTIPDQQRTLRDRDEIAEFLAPYGIWYEQWPVTERVGTMRRATRSWLPTSAEIEILKERGGFTTADVVSVCPDTPDLEVMLDKFRREHTHDEDEVRFTVQGRGVFHVHGDDDTVFAIEVEAGDLINVPRGTRHWFNLCADRTIRCIRLFQDRSGWTPHYVEGSSLHESYLPGLPGSAIHPGRSSVPSRSPRSDF